MSNTVIFVGKVVQAYLKTFIKKGYSIGCFVEKKLGEDAKSYTIEKLDEAILADLDFVIPLDFSSEKNLEEVKNFYFKKNTVLIPSADKYVLSASHISTYLGLKQAEILPTDIVRKSTNKILQRDCFLAKYPEISPAYRKVRTFHSMYMFTRKYGFPVVVKPASLSQSQLVYRCNNLEELIKHGSYILDHVQEVYQRAGINRKALVLIEQFVEGKLYSVDSYVSDTGKITHTPPCREYIGYEMGIESFQLPYSCYPANVNQDQETIIFDTVTKAIEAVGIKGSVVHTEVKIDENNACKVIELSPRQGGLRHILLDLAYGINHTANSINVILDKPVDVTTKSQNIAGFLKLWPKQEGVLKSIINFDKLEKLKTIKNLERNVLEIKTGQKVGPAEQGYPRAMTLVFSGSDENQVNKDVQWALQNIKFELEN